MRGAGRDGGAAGAGRWEVGGGSARTPGGKDNSKVWHRQPSEVARTVTPLFKDLPWPISAIQLFVLFFCFGGGTTKEPKRRMRQLKGKPKKETSRDKKERKQAMQEARQQITTVVLPTMAVVVLLIVVFVYVATRPNSTE